MKANTKERGAWTRRDIVRAGSLATAAGMMGAIGSAAAAETSPLPGPAHSSETGPEVYTQIAAVACVSAAAAPDVTMAPSLPRNSAIRAPTFSISSSRSTA